MRYDTPINFRKNGAKVYVPATGNYEVAKPTDTKVYASVMDTRTETLRLVYGEIRQGSLTIQLQQPYTAAFDSIVVNSKVYSVDYSRRLREKQTFVVSEVQ